MSETSSGPDEHPKVVDLMDALERSVAEAKEARKRHGMEYVPVAILEQPEAVMGTAGPMVFPMTREGWEDVRVNLVEDWEMPPPFEEPVTVDPAQWGPGFTLRFSVMTRAELDALPEHGGW